MKNNRDYKIIIYYMMLQVLSDLITTYMVRETNINISLSTIFRGLFLVYATFKVLINGNKSGRYLLSVLLFFIIAHTIYQSNRHSYTITYHAMIIVKSFTFPIVLIYFYSFFSNDENNIENQGQYNKILKAISISTIIYSTVIVGMYLLGIGIPSYPGKTDMRIGSIGYFISANEMGPFMLTMSAISFHDYLKTKSMYSNIAVIMAFFTTMVIGTKSAFIVGGFVFLMYLVFNLSDMWIKKSLNKRVLVLIVIMFGATFVMPGVSNFKIQKQQQAERSYLASLKKGDPVRDIEQKRHDNAAPINTGDVTSGLSLFLSDEDLIVTGYMYPHYEDLGHPNFVNVEMIIVEKSGKENIFELNSTYNANIRNEKESDYSSRFSGFEKKIHLNDIDVENPFKVFIQTTIDSDRQYLKELDYTTESRGSVELKLEKCHDGYSKFVENVNVDEHNGDNLPPVSSTNQYRSLWDKLLSGRASRAISYFEKYGPYNTVDMLIGTGQLRYGVVGLEMDLIEIFIIYGLIGSLLYFGLGLFIITKSFRKQINLMFTDRIVSLPYLALLLPSLLTIVIGTLSGHTFISPRVAIMLAFMISILPVSQERESTKNEKTL